MKILYLSIGLLIAFSSCAQGNIEPRYKGYNYGTDGIYYKDTFNDYNVFEGTWILNNQTTFFKIILQKKEHLHGLNSFSNYYTDAIVGEYLYAENGVDHINTLSNLNNNYQNPYSYNIAGGYISKYGDNTCLNCNSGNIAVEAYLSEPNCDNAPENYFYMRHFFENGIEKIEVIFNPISGVIRDPDLGNLCLEYTIPYGSYILEKQD
jgi:hypothetical protein